MNYDQAFDQKDTGGIREMLSGSGYSDKAIEYYLNRPNMGSLPDANQVTELTGRFQIHENIFSTGELKGIKQSLVVRSWRGLGRAGEGWGGLHGFRDLDLLRDFKVICPCHCTQHVGWALPAKGNAKLSLDLRP